MPISAMFYVPLALVPAPVAFLGRYLAGVVCLGLILKWLVHMLHMNISRQRRFMVLAFTLLFSLKYIIRDLEDGGPHLILLAMLVAGMNFVRRGKNMAGGFCFALAIVLKMTPGLLFPYLAWKRRWRLLLITTAATPALIVAPVLWLGPSLWWRCPQQWHEVAFSVFFRKAHAGLEENHLRGQNQSLKIASMHH